MRSRALFSIILLWHAFGNAAVQLDRLILLEDNTIKKEPFNFPLGRFAATANGEQVYVAADPSLTDTGIANEFAVSRASRSTEGFMPIAPKAVTLNGKQTENPFFDQPVALTAIMQNNNIELNSRFREHLVAVLANNLKSIYLFESIFNDGSVVLISARNGATFQNNIPDANGNVTSGIQGIAAGANYIFAATAPEGGLFGDPGSGVAEVAFGQDVAQSQRQETTVIVLSVVDAITGASGETNRAAELARTSTAVKIGSDLASMSFSDILFDVNIGRPYVALNVQAAGGAGDGARGIALGDFSASTNILNFVPIAPDSVFDGSLDKIVGAQMANVQVSIEKVRAMRTSTNLSYLIVLGNVGAPGPNQELFALPLVTGNSNKSLNGTIASKDAIPENIFAEKAPFQFIGRALPTPATTPSEMPTASDLPVQVGGGPLAQGPISDIWVRDDTVFVSVFNPEAGEAPGIFYSQALFDENSKIKCWTAWRRAVGTTQTVRSFGLDPDTANFSFIITPTDTNGVVQRTVWGSGAPDGLQELSRAIKNELEPEQITGNVQGIREFPFGTPGLTGIAATLVTSRNEIILAQTGRTVNGAQLPLQGSEFGNLTRFENGALNQNLAIAGSNLIGIRGGILDEIGPIVTGEIVTNGSPGTQAWLVVGGARGVAILSASDGSGWNPTTHLSNGLAGLRAGMNFKKLGDYQDVRSVVNDGQFLYIMTSRQLDRIDLTQGNVGLNQITPVTIADPVTISPLLPNDSFLDFVVSQKLGLIASTGGLLRVGDDHDIRTAQSTPDVGWTLVNLPFGLRTVQQLAPVSTTGLSQDMARGACGGQLYVFEGDRGNNQSRVHRFVIQSVETTPITSGTVQLFQDFVLKDTLSFILNFGSFRNLFTTDGALYFTTMSRFQQVPPHLFVTPAFPEVRVGIHLAGVGSMPIPGLNISNSGIIVQQQRSSAAGSWILSGDFGMRINE